MPRSKVVTDIEIDEVSLVDRPANQFAKVAIAKRATEEDVVPEVYDEDGNVIDLNTIEFGDVVYDDEGNAFEVVAEDDDEEVEEYEDDREPVGKSLADAIREDLSKAHTDSQRDEILSKAMEEVDFLRESLSKAETIAKAERDLRLTSEYVEVAKNYNLPIDAEELGPVLMRMAESMSDQDCSIIHKALTTSGSALFEEIGYVGMADNADPFQQIEAQLEQTISKSEDGKISKADAMSDYFAQNPAAYDEYLATRRGF